MDGFRTGKSGQVGVGSGLGGQFGSGSVGLSQVRTQVRLLLKVKFRG